MKKIKGSSIIESMIAMVIVGLVISSAIALFVSISKDSFLERNQLAYTACSTWFDETLISKEYIDEERFFDSFNLNRIITNKEEDNLIELRIEAQDKFGEVILARKQLIKKE